MKLEDAIKSTKFKDQRHKAVLNVLYTAWYLKTFMSQELKALGLTHEQYNVLRILKGKHPEQMCVRDIGCRIMEKNSNVPRIIDRLELKKCVDRSVSDEDKRETLINLTLKGLNVLEISTEKLEIVFEKIVNINEVDAIQLNEMLEQLRNKA